MTTETLYKKTGRYLCGAALPAETKQVQNWLSCIDEKKIDLTTEEKARIENEILADIQAHTAYPLFFPKTITPWWKKITGFF